MQSGGVLVLSGRCSLDFAQVCRDHFVVLLHLASQSRAKHKCSTAQKTSALAASVRAEAGHTSKPIAAVPALRQVGQGYSHGLSRKIQRWDSFQSIGARWYAGCRLDFRLKPCVRLSKLCAIVIEQQHHFSPCSLLRSRRKLSSI